MSFLGDKKFIFADKRTKVNLNKIFMIKKIKKFNFWTIEEDKLLLEVTEKCSQKNWLEIAKHFKTKNPVQCSARFLKIKPGIKKGHWSREEDKMILEHVDKYGTKWSQISHLMINRTGKQIRDRYLNYLDYDKKRDKFTTEEDDKIKELYIKYGSKWTKISKCIDRRTPEMIKNKFYSYLKSKIHIYERRKYDHKRLRLTTSKKKKKKIHNIKFAVFDDFRFQEKRKQFERQKSIEIMYINNDQPDSLSVCTENNFSYYGEIPQILSFVDNYKLNTEMNKKEIEKIFENQFILNKFAYFYLEKCKNQESIKYF